MPGPSQAQRLGDRRQQRAQRARCAKRAAEGRDGVLRGSLGIDGVDHCMGNTELVGGLVAIFYFPIYWE